MPVTSTGQEACAAFRRLVLPCQPKLTMQAGGQAASSLDVQVC